MDEFELIGEIQRIYEGSAPSGRGIVLGIGDDAAVLDPGGEKVVVTTDSLVEGTHFRWKWCCPEDVGFKAVAVNLSDLAAMGARPLALLTSITIPGSMTDGDVIRLSRGVAEAAGRFRVGVAGGNVTGTDGPCEVTITAVGVTAGGVFLTRSGVRPGDAILVSGTLGSAAMGLALLESGEFNQLDYPCLVASFRRPEPRLDIGAVLCGGSGVHCAIDLSDGLIGDMGHLLESSQAGAILEVDRIPLDPESRRLHDMGGPDPVLAALTGGEDYQLLACVDENDAGIYESAGMTIIGRITGDGGGIRLRLNGNEYPLPARAGYRHR